MEDNSRGLVNFQIFMRVKHDANYIQHIGPQDMDKLGDEIAMALQRCAVPESSSGIDQEEVIINGWMMESIATIHACFARRAQRSMNSHDGALITLLNKTIITPTNLQALLCMCDPSIRTGDIRCMAIVMLAAFAQIMLTYKLHLQIPNDTNGTSFSSFDEMLGTTMIKVSSQGTAFCLPLSRNNRCNCAAAPWLTMAPVLSRTLASVSTSNEEMLDFVSSQDWPAFLQSHKAVGTHHQHEIIFSDVIFFAILHDWVCRVLIADPNNAKAKAILREKLGSCHELLRKVLRRIITGEIFTPEASSHGRSRMDEIVLASGDFIRQFSQCLVPVPVDRETKSLVRRVLAFINNLVMQHSPNVPPARCIRWMIIYMENWQDLHDLPEQARWTMFRREVLDPKATQASLIKGFRKFSKASAKTQRNTEDGEMCANCFVLEKTLLDGSNQMEGLMKCSRCLQIKYCSRECQREHWKKAHKKHCQKVEKPAASSAKKSNP